MRGRPLQLCAQRVFVKKIEERPAAVCAKGFVKKIVRKNLQLCAQGPAAVCAAFED